MAFSFVIPPMLTSITWLSRFRSFDRPPSLEIGCPKYFFQLPIFTPSRLGYISEVIEIPPRNEVPLGSIRVHQKDGPSSVEPKRLTLGRDEVA